VPSKVKASGAALAFVRHQVSDSLAVARLTKGFTSMWAVREMTEIGGLISYGVSLDGTMRRAAEYVDRIARGARPADLPVEQPTKFELVINLKTARTLGIDVAPQLQQLADEVIE
jgi:putative ABC transport system substrate-binding protein